MKATGVVRRIDELGRIVIPKELRKNMRIKNGENLEIYTVDNEQIVLKKYSNIKNIDDLANFITYSIFKNTKCTTFIFDNDELIACSGNNKKEYINKNISDIPNNNIVKEIKLNGDIVGVLGIETDDNSLEVILDIFVTFLEKYLD